MTCVTWPVTSVQRAFVGSCWTGGLRCALHSEDEAHEDVRGVPEDRGERHNQRSDGLSGRGADSTDGLWATRALSLSFSDIGWCFRQPSR